MMAARKSKKKQYLNVVNAAEVANRGINAAWTQGHNQFVPVESYDRRGQPVIRFVEGTQAYGATRLGRLAGTGKSGRMARYAAKTWTFTPKNDDGSPVIGKDGNPRQSGRSTLSSYRQRRYDVIAGLNNVVGIEARRVLGIEDGKKGLGASIG